MNLRCTYCQTPFAIGRLEKLAAIQKMQAEDLHHYDAFCPRCRRANSVSRQRLEIFTPGWQDGLKTLEAEAARAELERQDPIPAAPTEAKPAAPAAETRRRHSPRPEPAAPTQAASTPKAKKAPAKAAPASKSKSDAKKPAAKPAAKKSAEKPAAKKSTAKPAAKKTVKKK